MVKYWLTVHLLLVGGDHTRLMDIPEISMAACLTDVAEVSEAFQANLANVPQPIVPARSPIQEVADQAIRVIRTFVSCPVQRFTWIVLIVASLRDDRHFGQSVGEVIEHPSSYGYTFPLLTVVG